MFFVFVSIVDHLPTFFLLFALHQNFSMCLDWPLLAWQNQDRVKIDVHMHMGGHTLRIGFMFKWSRCQEFKGRLN
jgi:hypothetical protein